MTTIPLYRISGERTGSTIPEKASPLPFRTKKENPQILNFIENNNLQALQDVLSNTSVHFTDNDVIQIKEYIFDNINDDNEEIIKLANLFISHPNLTLTDKHIEEFIDVICSETVTEAESLIKALYPHISKKEFNTQSELNNYLYQALQEVDDELQNNSVSVFKKLKIETIKKRLQFLQNTHTSLYWSGKGHGQGANPHDDTYPSFPRKINPQYIPTLAYPSYRLGHTTIATDLSLSAQDSFYDQHNTQAGDLIIGGNKLKVQKLSTLFNDSCNPNVKALGFLHDISLTINPAMASDIHRIAFLLEHVGSQNSAYIDWDMAWNAMKNESDNNHSFQNILENCPIPENDYYLRDANDNNDVMLFLENGNRESLDGLIKHIIIKIMASFSLKGIYERNINDYNSENNNIQICKIQNLVESHYNTEGFKKRLLNFLCDYNKSLPISERKKRCFAQQAYFEFKNKNTEASADNMLNFVVDTTGPMAIKDYIKIGNKPSELLHGLEVDELSNDISWLQTKPHKLKFSYEAIQEFLECNSVEDLFAQFSQEQAHQIDLQLFCVQNNEDQLILHPKVMSFVTKKSIEIQNKVNTLDIPPKIKDTQVSMSPNAVDGCYYDTNNTHLGWVTFNEGEPFILTKILSMAGHSIRNDYLRTEKFSKQDVSYTTGYNDFSEVGVNIQKYPFLIHYINILTSLVDINNDTEDYEIFHRRETLTSKNNGNTKEIFRSFEVHTDEHPLILIKTGSQESPLKYRDNINYNPDEDLSQVFPPIDSIFIGIHGKDTHHYVSHNPISLDHPGTSLGRNSFFFHIPKDTLFSLRKKA